MQRLQTLIPMSNAELMFTSAFVVALGIMILVLVMHLRSPRTHRDYGHETLFDDGPTSTTLDATSIHTTNPLNGSLLGSD